MNDLRVFFSRIHPDAVILEYQTPGAAGMDLSALVDGFVTPGRSELIQTGIAIEIPPGYEATVRPRSGLSSKNVVAAFGTIDSDYRGGIAIRLMNFSQQTFHWAKGQRLAQLVVSPVARCQLIESGLSATARGASGFGSTGE